MTPALSLYLLAAKRAEPFMRSRVAETALTCPRPTGDVVWIHLGAGQPVESATMLAARVAEESPATAFVHTADEAREDRGKPTILPRPPDLPHAVDAFLAHWRPVVAVWIGGPIWPVLAASAHRERIPMLLVNAEATLAAAHRTVPARDLLGLFTEIVARSPADALTLQRLARRAVDAKGALERSAVPLDYDEQCHARVSASLQSRPLWYAASATDAEIDELLDAHAAAQVGSHRLLLVVRPADAPADARLADRFPRRSQIGTPPPGANAFVADRPGEEGMWYRLAPVSFVGGSLHGPAAADPFAPAALGSAVIHGPHHAPFPDQFALLDAARATRRVSSDRHLGPAVSDLLAPDRAAELARRAWAVVSEGAEATDHVAEAVLRLLEGTR